MSNEFVRTRLDTMVTVLSDCAIFAMRAVTH